MAAMQHELQQQRELLEALKRQKTTTVVKEGKEQAKPVSERKPPPGSMLFISHDLTEAEPGPKGREYTLAPGDTKIACQIETAMNSNVEGYFIAKVTTNVYDTATRRHLLIPQGSSILGHDQSSQLLYGDERMDTISLKLTLPDGRTVDLGKAPVTDQQGVAGFTGRVDQHYWRLFGAVFIGGALKGGMNAMQTAMSQAGGAGQVTSGPDHLGNQATNQVVAPMLNTRPTIEVDAGQLCQVLVAPAAASAGDVAAERAQGSRAAHAGGRSRAACPLATEVSHGRRDATKRQRPTRGRRGAAPAQWHGPGRPFLCPHGLGRLCLWPVCVQSHRYRRGRRPASMGATASCTHPLARAWPCPSSPGRPAARSPGRPVLAGHAPPRHTEALCSTRMR